MGLELGWSGMSKRTLGEEIGELTAEVLSVCWPRRAFWGALEVAHDMSRTRSGRACLPRFECNWMLWA
jgi:hypothetical protein